jgi:hypothetical protein
MPRVSCLAESTGRCASGSGHIGDFRCRSRGLLYSRGTAGWAEFFFFWCLWRGMAGWGHGWVGAQSQRLFGKPAVLLTAKSAWDEWPWGSLHSVQALFSTSAELVKEYLLVLP